MEVQLEEEYDEKQKVLKERRDLEGKLLSAQDQVNTHWTHAGWLMAFRVSWRNRSDSGGEKYSRSINTSVTSISPEFKVYLGKDMAD